LIVILPNKGFYPKTIRGAPLLERLGGRVGGLRVLEVGCGCGFGTELPDHLILTLDYGDTAIAEDDESFDAVFEFAIIHHVPNWQASISEICRVLKRGGRFFFEEVTNRAINRWSYRMFFDHPIGKSV
jgi:ubiquinone/menaquinone biosynthesis C-methylase UbiE